MNSHNVKNFTYMVIGVILIIIGIMIWNSEQDEVNVLRSSLVEKELNQPTVDGNLPILKNNS